MFSQRYSTVSKLEADLNAVFVSPVDDTSFLMVFVPKKWLWHLKDKVADTPHTAELAACG